MLPITLLPDINALRAQANQVMQAIVTLFEPTVTYDTYGQQAITSGNIIQVSGYVGAISGKDKEFLSTTIGRNGVEITHSATLLLPVGTVITETYNVIVNGSRYNVIWVNNDTMDGVKVYTKAIITKIDRTDEVLPYDV